MKGYDIIFGLYLFTLVASVFNATIFADSNVHTQGLDTSGMTAEITNYQNKVGQAVEQPWYESWASGVGALVSAIAFVIKLFLTPLGVRELLINWGVNSELTIMFTGALSIIFAWTIFMLITNRNTKWME